MILVFATHNENKLKEVKKLLPEFVELISLTDMGCKEEIPETGTTIEENAVIKSRFVYERYHTNCFSDDSGLEVDVLDGKPGVLSARYAGEPKNDQRNIQKLLEALKKENNRKARFKTVISLIMNGREFLFEGIINGNITNEPIGSGGFGYDPVFIPDGSSKTFAQMDLSEKNKISHRALAIDRLVEFIKKV